VLFPPSRTPAAPPRVVITGAGIITPLGLGWRANADGFRAGRPTFRPVTLFDVSRQRSRIAAEVDLPADLPDVRLTPRTRRRLDRAARLLLFAAHEAWQQAGWEPGATLPLVLGTTSGGMSLGQDYLRQAIEHPFSNRRQASRIAYYQAQQQALDFCAAFGLQGPITLIANACASGANAIGHAWTCLRHGQAERALAGGYDGLSQLTFAGFDALQTLSPTACQPFHPRRNGLSLGEGAAVLALETLEHARQRNARVLAEIVGYAAVTDPHHLTQPQPQGEAACAAMNAACAGAGLGAAAVDYLNAHGTGTPHNDSSEAIAINRWAGAHARRLRVSSTKAVIGHALGAAGAIESVVCLMALCEQWLPPQPNLETVDPICEFQIVRAPTNAALDLAASNSFGFGGANATLLFQRWA
jgi:3-oxoacyl-[acyl-carrier-protein] synthase II